MKIKDEVLKFHDGTEFTPATLHDLWHNECLVPDGAEYFAAFHRSGPIEDWSFRVNGIVTIERVFYKYDDGISLSVFAVVYDSPEGTYADSGGIERLLMDIFDVSADERAMDLKIHNERKLSRDGDKYMEELGLVDDQGHSPGLADAGRYRRAPKLVKVKQAEVTGVFQGKLF